MINNDLPVNAAVKNAVFEEYDYRVSDYYQPYVDIYSDMLFTCPATTIAKAHAKARDTLYRYLVRKHLTLLSICNAFCLNLMDIEGGPL